MGLTILLDKDSVLSIRLCDYVSSSAPWGLLNLQAAFPDLNIIVIASRLC